MKICKDMICVMLDETGYAIKESLDKDFKKKNWQYMWIWIEPDGRHSFGLEPRYLVSDC